MQTKTEQQKDWPEQPEVAAVPAICSEPSLQVATLDLHLAGKLILDGIQLRLPASGITTLFGPSGAGKTSLLRCLNLLESGWTGSVTVAGTNVREWPGGGDGLRRHIGFIAQKPVVFPGSVRDNVLFGLRGWRRWRRPAGLVKNCLTKAALWTEVADRLPARASQLSVGQQQRLCIARALAVSPLLLLLDEPTASLDSVSKKRIEHSLVELAREMPVLCVTHDIDQVHRLGGQTVFMCNGRIIEAGAADKVLNVPQRIATREFLQWAVCEC